MIRDLVVVASENVPESVSTALSARGFESRLVASLGAVTPADSYDIEQRIRCIVLSSGVDDTARLKLVQDLRLAKRHLELGSNIVVASTPESRESAMICIKDQGFAYDTRIRVVDIVAGQEAPLKQLGDIIALHDPGPPAARVRFLGDDPGDHALLLARAFCEFEQIRLTRLRGGGAMVYQVDPSDGRLKYEPFIVKIDQRKKIQQEVDNYRQYVERHIPFPCRAPFLQGRRVDGYERGALVSWFVSGSRRFDRCFPDVNPTQTISALFTGALKTWRSIRQVNNASIGQVYRTSGRLFDPTDAGLHATYQVAANTYGNVRRPADVHRDLLRMPSSQLEFCYTHGDLHLRNIFLREHGYDVILIDFYASRGQSIASRDPATLEVALAFLSGDDVNGIQPLSEALLRELYQQRAVTLQHASDESDRRTQAILAIRRDARCANPIEYDVSLGVVLIGTALRMRSALAYSLGDALLSAAAGR